jgi:hypothetical protein
MKKSSSYHQQRLWFIDHFEKDYLYQGGPVYHNISLGMQTKNSISVATIEKAVKTLLQKHNVLRTQLYNENEAVYQSIHTVEELALENILIPTENITTRKEALRTKPFDFANELLFKCYYAQLESGTLFYMVIHHAIADRRSLAIIREDFTKLLTQPETFNEEVIPYTTFSDWQNSLGKDDLESLLFYWKSKLRDLQVLYFPTDMERKQVHIYEAAKETLRLEKSAITDYCK